MHDQTARDIYLDKQKKRFSLSAKNLCWISLALWLASLPLTGFVIYAGQKETKGIEILAIGWLGLLMLNFAWLANPVFLVTLWRISVRKKAIGLAIIGLLLALDTLRFTAMLLDEGGGHSDIYGYGWGAILWFMALCFALAAAGALEVERRAESKANNVEAGIHPASSITKVVGFAIVVLALAITGTLFYKDRTRANQAELLRLKGLAFKRLEVCAAPQPKAAAQIDVANGAVEVINANSSSTTYPFNGPEQLLKWGVPKVRFGNRDYYLGQLDGKTTTISDAASGAPFAQLFVTDSVVDGRSQITAKLVDVAKNQVLFNQSWLAETKSTIRFCPEFSSFPRADEQPRRILTEALRVGNASPVELSGITSKKPFEVIRVTAEIKSVKESKERPVPNGRGGFDDPRAAGSLGWQNNRNCPKNTGWGGAAVKQTSATVSTGWPFIIGEKMFYLGNRDEYNALCQDEAVYLSGATAENGKNFIRIEKRSLVDFQSAWIVTVVIDKQITPYPQNNLKLKGVSETNSDLTLTLINERDWTEVEMTIPAPLPLRR